MRLRNLLSESGPWPMMTEPFSIALDVERRWGGTLTFMTIGAAQRRWRADGRDPTGGAESLAFDIERAILAGGGEDEHVRRVLLACMSSHLYT